MGVATYGLGNLGPRSVERLVLDFIDEHLHDEADPTVNEVADALHAYVLAEFNAVMEGVPEDERPEMGLLVAGHSSDEPFAYGKEFVLPRDESPTELFGPAAAGAQWRGVDLPFIRLWKGFDPGLIAELLERGADQETVFAALPQVEAFAVYDGMPVQDAIDFAVFILNTTIGYTTFIPGVASCGGPLQIAVILPDQGFVWISKPELRAGGSP